MGDSGDLAGRLAFIQSDITQAPVDAIVNPANTDLILGAGVAGAILKNGGESIQTECRALAPVGLGDAVITTAGRLPAKWVIHAAVMVLGGSPTERSVFLACDNSLKTASRRRFRTIAIPAMGTGVGGMDLDLSARILIGTTLRFLEAHKYPQTVRFILFDDYALRLFQTAFEKFRF